MPSLPTPTGSFEAPEVGTYLAVCSSVIDLGTQENTYQGKTSSRRQVFLEFEILEEANSMGLPYTMGAFYTWSMSPQANLRTDLEAWRGKAFTEDEMGEGGFEIFDVVGKCALIGIEPKKQAEGVKIGSVSAPMKGQAKKATPSQEIRFWMSDEEFDRHQFEMIGPGLQKKIKLSPEWRHMVAAGKMGVDDGSDEPAHQHELDDEIPF